MPILKRLFCSKKSKAIPPIPPWEEIVKHMRDIALNFGNDKVVDVIYSTDGAKRFIVLNSTNGYYKVEYQYIYVVDNDEWMYFCNEKDACPAFWETEWNWRNSFYGSREDALREIKACVEYCNYFE